MGLRVAPEKNHSPLLPLLGASRVPEPNGRVPALGDLFRVICLGPVEKEKPRAPWEHKPFSFQRTFSFGKKTNENPKKNCMLLMQSSARATHVNSCLIKMPYMRKALRNTQNTAVGERSVSKSMSMICPQFRALKNMAAWFYTRQRAHQEMRQVNVRMPGLQPQQSQVAPGHAGPPIRGPKV